MVNLVVSACTSPPSLSLLYESPPALHCFINTHLYSGPPPPPPPLLTSSDEGEGNRRVGEEEKEEEVVVERVGSG